MAECIRCHQEIKSHEIMLRRLDEVEFASIHEECLARWHGKLPGSLGRGIAGQWDRAFFQRGTIDKSKAKFMGAFTIAPVTPRKEGEPPSSASTGLVDKMIAAMESHLKKLEEEEAARFAEVRAHKPPE